MVKKGDLIQKNIEGKDYAEVFECICADDEVFVIGRSKFRRIEGTNDYEVCGVSYENLRAFPNTEKALMDNNLIVLLVL